MEDRSKIASKIGRFACEWSLSCRKEGNGAFHSFKYNIIFVFNDWVNDRRVCLDGMEIVKDVTFVNRISGETIQYYGEHLFKEIIDIIQEAIDEAKLPRKMIECRWI